MRNYTVEEAEEILKLINIIGEEDCFRLYSKPRPTELSVNELRLIELEIMDKKGCYLLDLPAFIDVAIERWS